jgi:hypothetical protein
VPKRSRATSHASTNDPPEDDRAERRRRRDEHLQRPVPALDRDRPAGVEEGEPPERDEHGRDRGVRGQILAAGVLEDEHEHDREERRREERDQRVGVGDEELELDARAGEERAHQTVSPRSPIAWT